MSAAGGAVTTATVDPSGGCLVVEVPIDADVRTIVEQIGTAHPTFALRARRERDRDVATVDRPGGLLDELTDRQREALETAYRAGYFAWPRGSTAEQVAETLDVASSTLHGHLRKAEQALLAELFDRVEE